MLQFDFTHMKNAAEAKMFAGGGGEQPTQPVVQITMWCLHANTSRSSGRFYFIAFTIQWCVNFYYLLRISR